jgi:hypothetical protein
MNTITIQSINYSGEVANIIFKPSGVNIVINLGNQVLPYEFNPLLLSPSRDVYGTYTILVEGSDCPSVMNVPEPTPTPTQTQTPTKTPTSTPTVTPTITITPTKTLCIPPTKTPTSTPAVTPTITITPTNTRCLQPSVTPTKTLTNTPTSTQIVTETPTNTPTVTPTITETPTNTPTETLTPTPTPTIPYYAYLFIEPVSGSEDIGQWMYDNGRDFFGFTNYSQPTQDQTDFDVDMNTYVDFSGWTSGLFPSLIQQIVPQTSGGQDSFNNPIVEYNFLTTEIPQGYVGGRGWYSWIIPVSLTNYEKQTIIEINVTDNPNLLTNISTEGVINNYTFYYTGTTIPQTTYRVYTTYPNTIFNIIDNQNIYMRGNTIEPATPFQLGRNYVPDVRDNNYLIKDNFQLIKSVTRVVRVVPTKTPTPTKTRSITITPTPTPTKTRSIVPTPTPTPTKSRSVLPTPTPTPTPINSSLTSRYWDANMWWGNQGNTPQCVGYAWAHWIADGPVVHSGVQPPVNPKLIYQQAQLVDEWPGTNYNGTSVRGGAKYLNSTGKIGNYYWAYDVQTLVNTLLQIGPVVVGTNWYNNMFYPNSNGVISIGGSLAGGHAYVINGVDTVNKLFRIKNSWGVKWGKSGHAFISFTDMTRLINERGEICLAIENNF